MYDNESCTNVQFSSWDCIIQGSCWPNGKASEYESEDSGWKETCFDHHVAYDFLNAYYNCIWTDSVYRYSTISSMPKVL